jgi:hypothetical protein
VKTGANYNINQAHNVFFNAGYYSRQPFFDDLFLNISTKSTKTWAMKGFWAWR